MTTRQEQKEKKKEEIAMAALDLFVNKGYASTKTIEISKAVSISEGLLFHYFKSKEFLLETLVDTALARNKQWLDIETVNPVEYLKQIIESVLECLEEDEINADFFMLIGQIKQNEGIPEHIYEKVAKQEQEALQLAELIKKGQKEGLIRKGDPLALLYLFSDTLQTIALHRRQHRNIPLPEPQWILDMLLVHNEKEPR